MNGRLRGNILILIGLPLLALSVFAGVSVWRALARDNVPVEHESAKFVDAAGNPVIFDEQPLAPEDAVPATVVGVNKGITASDTLSPENMENVNSIPRAILTSHEKGMWIYIDKADFRLYLVNGVNVVDSWPIAVGENKGNKEKEGDKRTPEGNFEIQEIKACSHWGHDFKDGKGWIPHAYGPWFLRLKTGWKGIGIHGTHDPASMGTCASEGCVRMKNDDLVKLKEHVTIGMPVLVAPN